MPNTPRVLLYDTENSPIIGCAWDKYETNLIHIIQTRRIISIAWKWLDHPKVYCKAINDYYGNTQRINKPLRNRKLIEMFHKVISSADIVVGQNVDKFDDRRLNAEFIEYGLPPVEHQSFDTLKVARSRFGFTSNHLNDIAKLLGVGQKVNTGGFELWLNCMNGDKKAWDKMKKYNAQDVVLLENVYLRLRGWAKTHPVMGLKKKDNPECPTCGKSDGVISRGWRMTHQGRRKQMSCNNCGKWFYTFLEEHHKYHGKKSIG